MTYEELLPILEKSCELIKENHEKTNEVRALFESECGIHHNFFDFVWYGAKFEKLKSVPNGFNAFVKCAMILNEHYEQFAKKVEDYTVNYHHSKEWWLANLKLSHSLLVG